MKSKAEIIAQNLKELRVLDLGGSGYGEDNAYERQLQAAWRVCAQRTTVDYSDQSDHPVNFNSLPLRPIQGEWDIATAFDVLEHLEHPVDVLRWIPTKKLLVTLPNGLSWLNRRMEERNRSKHLYSFTPYTAGILLNEGGWRVDRVEFQFGKWSFFARLINLFGSLYPRAVGTGIVLHATRVSAQAAPAWVLR